MRRKHKEVENLIWRYLIIFLTALPKFWIFYVIFTPLTIFSSYFLLDLVFNTAIDGNIILVSGRFPIEIVRACVAGSAYYLLFMLNIATPHIKMKKRITMLALAFAVLFTLNTFRIFFLSLLFVNQSVFFDITHKVFWYFISIVFVVGIWFTEVKIFKIKEIPFYSDINWLQKKIRK